MRADSNAETVQRFQHHVEALKTLFDDYFSKESTRCWEPVVVDTKSLQQCNVVDCGPSVAIQGFFISMGHSVSEIRQTLGSGDKIRLFLANLLLQACTQKIIQPVKIQSQSRPKKKIKKDLLHSSQPFRQDLCLSMTDVPIDSTKSEKDLLQFGYTILEKQFHFEEKDVNGIISAFEGSPDKIKPIRNSAEDLDAGSAWNIPGESAPRSMVYESDLYNNQELDLIEQVKNALRYDPALKWLTQSRRQVKFTVLRSKPGTAPQFWHRDYCLKQKRDKRMPSRKVPLFLIVAVQKQTSLDFSTGKIYIPIGRVCVVRGDMIHRGAANLSEGVCHYRLHITIEEPDSEKYREDDTGEAEFEPADEEESKNYDEAYESEMLKRLTIKRRASSSCDGSKSTAGDFVNKRG
jgi:hypothetical protein